LNCGLCEVYVVSTIYCIICPNPESKWKGRYSQDWVRFAWNKSAV
jgi:hypothetical protein